VHLDLLGRLPRPDEIRAHVAGPEEGRRERIVDRLLGSEEAAHHWAERWTRILLTSQFREGDILSVDFASFQEWLKRSYLENLPYDRWVTALIAAKGEKAEHPEANFLAKYVYGNQSPIDLVNRVAQVFLGMEIGSHAMSDAPLTNHSPKLLEEEVTQSRRILEERLGVPVRAIAAPRGFWNARVADAVKRAGYDAAWLSTIGTNGRDTSPIALRRVVVRQPFSADRMVAMVEGWKPAFWWAASHQRMIRVLKRLLGVYRYEQLKRMLVPDA